MTSIVRVAAQDVVTSSNAECKAQVQQHVIYEGVTDGWRIWTGTATDTSAGGVALNGTSTGAGHQVSITGDIAFAETFYSITGADGSHVGMYFGGTVNRVTGAVDMPGTVTEATGAWAHLLGQDAHRVGTQFHPAGPFVPGKSTFDGVITIGPCAKSAEPKKTADLDGDRVVAPTPRMVTAAAAPATLQLVPPRRG